MKRTQFIELIHTIGKTWVSFFSIVMFVALGAGLYLGLNWAGQSVESASDSIYDSQSFHDFDISYAYGITRSDIKDLASVDGVDQVEGGYTAFATFNVGGQGHVARLMSPTSTVDRAICLEGTMPVGYDQIALDSAFSKWTGLGIGDTVTFDSDSNDDADGMQYLNCRTFTVTAIVDQPSYVVKSSSTRGMTNLSAGAADCYMIAPLSAFDMGAFDGCYSNAYVRCSSLDGLSTFSNIYATQAEMVKDDLTAIGKTDGAARYQSLHDAAQKKIDDATQQIADGETRIADSETQIADGETQIASAEQQIDDGEAQIASADQQIADYEAQASDAEDTLNEKLDILNTYQAEADAADAMINARLYQAAAFLQQNGASGSQDEIAEQLHSILDEAADSSVNIVDIARAHGVSENLIAKYVQQVQNSLDAYRDFRNKKAQLADGWDQYYAARDTLDEKESELADAKVQLEQKKTDLETAKTQLADAKVQLEQKKTDLETAKAQLADAKVQLQNAKDRLSQMVELSWNISGRSSNASVVGVEAYHDSTNRLRLSMALVFLIVGLLVCYTAVSRIVREQIVSIGTKKALGLRGREITASFLLYSAIAVVIGIVIAIFAAIFIEGIINKESAARFALGTLPAYSSVKDILLIGFIELVLICLSTWLACRRMLRRQAVDLLKGEEPPKNRTRFYEKWKLWDRMSLYSQSIINNFFNDKVRVIGTLVGIAGCTTLVVIAMTMYVNLGRTFDVQYDKITTYDSHVSISSDESTLEAVGNVIDESGAFGTPALVRTLGLLEPDGMTRAVTIEVPDDNEAFTSLFHLYNANGGGLGQIDDQGVWVSQAYAVHQKAKVGDTIKVIDSTGTTRELPIAGVFEYHLNSHVVIMSKSLYEKTFDAEATPNTVFIELNGTDGEQLASRLQQVDGFFSYTDDYTTGKNQFAEFQSLTRTVVFIYLGLSALMAIVVLMNLTVMFIEEKKRDLIVLMINGFSIKDAKRYIYRDNIVLTIIGIILGVLLGMLMGYLSLRSIEFDAGWHVHEPSLIACLSGVVVSAVFAFVINLIALRRIPRFKLTDINKI